MQAKVPVSAQDTSGPGDLKQTVQHSGSTQTSSSVANNQEDSQTTVTNQDFSSAQTSSAAFTDPSLACAFSYSLELDEFDFLDQQRSDTKISDEQSDSEEGEVSSDTIDKPEQTEDMNYRENCPVYPVYFGMEPHTNI